MAAAESADRVHARSASACGSLLFISLLLAQWPIGARGAKQPSCPAFRGWHEAGSFQALEDGKEPWHGSKRAPSSPHSANFLRLATSADVVASDVTCEPDGANRRFLWDAALFAGVTADKHIAQMPSTLLARVFPPDSHLIMIKLSAKEAEEHGAEYRQALKVPAWLALGAHVLIFTVFFSGQQLLVGVWSGEDSNLAEVFSSL